MIELDEYERGRKYHGDYKADLKALQDRLERVLVAHIIHDRRAVIAFEGWDAAGKGGMIQRLTAEWDQRNYEVYPISAPTAEEKGHDFLWRFRTRLPEPGNIVVFDRTWYGRVLVERVEGYASADEVERGYGEINAFEAELEAAGTTLIKVFIHTTQKEQDRRLRVRLADPWKRWKTGADDFRNRAKRSNYIDAMTEMFARTDTGGAPWIAIDGNNKKAARIAALSAIADGLEAAVPMDPPPLDPEVERIAREALGD